MSIFTWWKRPNWPTRGGSTTRLPSLNVCEVHSQRLYEQSACSGLPSTALVVSTKHLDSYATPPQARLTTSCRPSHCSIASGTLIDTRRLATNSSDSSVAANPSDTASYCPTSDGSSIATRAC